LCVCWSQVVERREHRWGERAAAARRVMVIVVGIVAIIIVEVN
jgi:hypothetical protein